MAQMAGYVRDSSPEVIYLWGFAPGCGLGSLILLHIAAPEAKTTSFTCLVPGMR